MDELLADLCEKYPNDNTELKNEIQTLKHKLDENFKSLTHSKGVKRKISQQSVVKKKQT